MKTRQMVLAMVGLILFVSITIPFSQDGIGQYCWVTTQAIAYINSWNLNQLTINGVDFTNSWSNNLPPAINGRWVIRYDGRASWSHFEAPQAKSATGDNQIDIWKESRSDEKGFHNFIRIATDRRWMLGRSGPAVSLGG